MLKYVISLVAAGSLLVVSAASPSIGIVRSAGEFRVDGSAVRGNGNVFDGTLVETAAVRSVIQLADAQIALAPESRVRVYRDRTVLEKGSGVVKDSTHHVIEAETLHIAPTAPGSVVEIAITGPSRVTVAARGGTAEVHNSSGVLTASLLPGMALAFEPRAAAAAAVKVTGTIESRSDAYLLTDETSKVTVQLVASPDVTGNAGRRVELTGSSIPGARPVGGASQVVRAVSIKPAGGKGKDRKVKAAGAAGAAGGATAAAGGVAAAGGAAAGAGAAAAGISGVAIGAIVGGVAVAGTVGGMAAAGTFSDAPPVSRQ